MRRPLAGGLIAVVASLPSVATEPLCLAHSPSKCAPSSSPANAAAALKPPMGAEVLADLLDGDPSTWVPKAVALDDAGDAKASLLAFIKIVQAQPKLASRWSDLGKWHIYHRPGGIRQQGSEHVVGSVAAATAALRMSAQVESQTQRRPVHTVSTVVDLAEQTIRADGGNTPEPLLAADLLELAMEIEDATGETWAINSGNFFSTDRGGPFHAVALALWEHGDHERAEAIWREQVVRLRGISMKDCLKKQCPYNMVESYMAAPHKLRHDAQQFRYIASKAGIGLVANRFRKEAAKLERLLSKEHPQQKNGVNHGIIVRDTYSEQQLKKYEVAESYNRAVHLPPYPRRRVPTSSRYATLNPKLEFSGLDAQYLLYSICMVTRRNNSVLRVFDCDFICIRNLCMGCGQERQTGVSDGAGT